MTIAEFCTEHGISRRSFYRREKEGIILLPGSAFKVSRWIRGGRRHVRITPCRVTQNEKDLMELFFHIEKIYALRKRLLAAKNANNN